MTSHGRPPDRGPEPSNSGHLEARFAETQDFAVGVEEEFQLVDPETRALVPRPQAIDAEIEDSDHRLQAEIFQASIETVTPICRDIDALGDSMRRLRSRVVETGKEHGFDVVASGTHPFAAWEKQPTTVSPRYDELIQAIQLPMKSDLVFGQHVHVGVGSREEAIRVTNDLRTHLPLLLALSTNAPFWRGMDSGLQSARVNVSECMPRSGLPPSFPDWGSFETLVSTLKRAGAIEDVTEVWWDLRPRYDLGTVEVRIADLPTRFGVSLGLAALTKGLVVDLARRFRRGEDPPREVPPAVLEENRWRAVRNGLDATFIEPTRRGGVHRASVPERFNRTLKTIAPTMDRLGLRDELAPLERRVRDGRTGADRQREVRERTGSLPAVVEDLVQRTPP